MLISLDIKVRPQLNQYDLLGEKLAPPLAYHDRLDLVLLAHRKHLDLSLQYLEPVFLDMYRSHFYGVCALCDENGLLTLCLLCGHYCCLRSCGMSELPDPDRNRIGNCHKHALEQHNGICAFLDCTQGRIILYEGRKLTLVDELFLDQFFNPVNSDLRTVDIRTFQNCRLVDKKVQAVRSAILDFAILERIIQDVFRNSLHYTQRAY